MALIWYKFHIIWYKFHMIFFLNDNLAQRGICMQGKCPRVPGFAAQVRIHSEEISNPQRRLPVSHNRGFKAFLLGFEPDHRPRKIPLMESEGVEPLTSPTRRL